MEKRNQSNGRRWCFTLNNPSKEELNHLKKMPDSGEFFIWQLENGDKDHTDHVQGYLELKKMTRFNAVKKLLGERCHIETAKGSAEDNIKYCTKPETRKESGIMLGKPRSKNQGKRNDLKKAAASVLETGSLKNVSPDIFCKYSSGLLKLQARIQGPYRPELKIITIVGYTGLGKSYSVFDNYSEVYVPYYGNAGIWFDGYLEQQVICLEEFKAQIPLQKLLKILDPYPLQLEVKGGSTWAYYTIVFITSNSTPDNWYSNEKGTRDEELNALYRRLGYPNGAYYIYIPKTNNTLSTDRRELKNRLHFATADSVPRATPGGLERLHAKRIEQSLGITTSTISTERESFASDTLVNNSQTLDGFDTPEILDAETIARLEALKK